MVLDAVLERLLVVSIAIVTRTATTLVTVAVMSLQGKPRRTVVREREKEIKMSDLDATSMSL